MLYTAALMFAGTIAFLAGAGLTLWLGYLLGRQLGWWQKNPSAPQFMSVYMIIILAAASPLAAGMVSFIESDMEGARNGCLWAMALFFAGSGFIMGWAMGADQREEALRGGT